MLGELRSRLEKDRNMMVNMSRTNPNGVFKHINSIGYAIGSKYGVLVQLHFPDPEKIGTVESYGNENLSIVVDPQRKRFPIPRESIKEKAVEFLGQVNTKDAYMYEGKEGVRVFLEDGRIDILPGSLHLWCEIDDAVRKFVDWLLLFCYGIKPV